MSDTEETELPPIDTAKLFRTIIQDLQTSPEHYRRFGLFWWPIKALLRRAGYDQTQLYMLGTYQDAESTAMVPTLDLAGTLRAAMDEYRFNTIYPRSDGMVENSEGELVRLADEDASL